MGIDLNETRLRRERRRNEGGDDDLSDTRPLMGHEDKPSWISKEKGVEVDKAIDALREKLSSFDVGQGLLGSGRNDGILSQKEMLRGLKEISNGNISEDELKAAKAILPKEGIAIEDFVNLIKGALQDSDKNKDGIVDPKEMPSQMAQALSELPSR